MSDPLRLTPETLGSLLAECEKDAFAAFVADLYERTGYEIEQRGEVVTVVAPDGDHERLLVWTDDRTRIERLFGTATPDVDIEGVDAVVSRDRDAATAAAIAEEADADLLETTDLHGRLLYAMDRETCREMCQEHFGQTVEPQPAPAEASKRTTLGGLSTARIALAALVVCGIVVVGAMGLPVSMLSDRDATVPSEEPSADQPGSGPVTPVSSEPGATPAQPLTGRPRITGATAIDLEDRDGVVSEGDIVRLSATVTDADDDITRVFTEPDAFGGGEMELTNVGGDRYNGTFIVGSQFPAEEGRHAIRILVEDGAGNTDISLTNVLRMSGSDETVQGTANVTGSLGNGSTGTKTVFAVPSDTDREFPEDGPFEARTLTNENGNFTLEVPVSDTYDIFYWQGIFTIENPQDLIPRDGVPDVFAIERVEVNDSDAVIGDQTLLAGHNLNVSVVNESGTPIEDAEVTYIHTEYDFDDPARASLLSLPTSADGLADVSDLNTTAREVAGLEVGGNVTVLVTPPEDDERFVDREYRRTLTVTGDRRITITLNESINESTPPTITNATAIDLEDGDGVVSNGDFVRVRASVTDNESDVKRVDAFPESPGPVEQSGPLSMTDDDGDGVYTTTVRVDVIRTTPGGTYAVEIRAIDEGGNVRRVFTNELGLEIEN